MVSMLAKPAIQRGPALCNHNHAEFSQTNAFVSSEKMSREPNSDSPRFTNDEIV
jgi:hypothetical protein